MFITKSLKESYERHKDIIDNISKNLDKVTAEINTLEKYLKGANLLDNFEYILPCVTETRVITSTNKDGETVYNEFLFIVKRGLYWDNQTKKIKYIQHEYNIGVNSDEYTYGYERVDHVINQLNYKGGWDLAAPDNNKSLLETKVQTRKLMLSHLGDFLKAIADEYTICGVSSDPPNYDDDIPF